MDLQSQRDLTLLNEVDRDAGATQRSLAAKMGMALGLTNLYLKRLARQGLISISMLPRNRTRYALTPLGVGEQYRLSCLFMQHLLSNYRDVRTRVREMLAPLHGHCRCVAICGTNELAELAYLLLREMHIECVGFIENDPRSESFLSCPLWPPERAIEWQCDRILVADAGHAEDCEAQLIKAGMSPQKLLRLSWGLSRWVDQEQAPPAYAAVPALRGTRASKYHRRSMI